MRFLRPLIHCFFLGVLLITMSGCTIDLGGLKELAHSIDGMRAQNDKRRRRPRSLAGTGPPRR
jgi:hypothetical protein